VKTPLEKLRRRWEVNVGMYLREAGWQGVDFSWLRIRTSGRIEHGSECPIKAENFLTEWLSFSRILNHYLLHSELPCLLPTKCNAVLALMAGTFPIFASSCQCFRVVLRQQVIDPDVHVWAWMKTAEVAVQITAFIPVYRFFVQPNTVGNKTSC